MHIRTTLCLPQRPLDGQRQEIQDSGFCRLQAIPDHHPRYDRCLNLDELLQYFGVFLCFLAENPHLINEILLTEPNTYGIHALRMNIGSKKEFIFIDDYIICCDRTPLFSQPIKGIYMWPCLLEKAWFKVKGSIAKKI